MTDLWSERAELYRAATEHRERRGSRARRRLVRRRAGMTVLDVATGGGHTAPCSAGAGCKVVTVDSAPGMEPDVISRAEELPFADGSFDAAVSRIAPHHFADVRAALARDGAGRAAAS